MQMQHQYEEIVNNSIANKWNFWHRLFHHGTLIYKIDAKTESSIYHKKVTMYACQRICVKQAT